MKILLDIDGVLVTTPPWRVPEILTDGFMKFNERAAFNLQRIIIETNATIVLTTTHRISYSVDTWKGIFRVRGISVNTILKLNKRETLEEMPNRATEIKEWVDSYGEGKKFVVIDDDLSIHGLSAKIKERCVITKPLIGLDCEATLNVLNILKY